MKLHITTAALLTVLALFLINCGQEKQTASIPEADLQLIKSVELQGDKKIDVNICKEATSKMTSDAGIIELWKKIIDRYPNDRIGLQVIDWLVKNKFIAENGTVDRGIEIAKEFISTLKDEALIANSRFTMLALYSMSDKKAQFRQVVEELRKNNQIDHITFGGVADKVIATQEWDLLKEICEDYIEFTTPQSLREWWLDLKDISDEDLSAYVKSKKGMAQTYIAWAAFKKGNVKESLNLFVDAANSVKPTLHGTANRLNYLYAKALIADGQNDKAMEVISPEALLENDNEALQIFEEAYRSSGRSDAELEAYKVQIKKKIDKKIPDFTLTDYQGNSKSWNSMKGEVTLLNFWYPTCGECQKEFPEFEKLYQKYKDRGFRIVAVETLRDTERAKKTIADKGLTFDLVENGKGDNEVARKVIGITHHPFSYVVDRDGRIMYVHPTYRENDIENYEREINELLDRQATD